MTMNTTQIGNAISQAQARGSLARSLQRFRGRVLAVGAGSGLAWGVAGAIACLIAGTWSDLVFELSPALRIGVLAASAGFGLLLFVLIVARAWQAGRSQTLARRLDHVGGTGGQILTGVDLLEDPQSRSPLAGGLAHMAIERAAYLAAKVAPRQAAPTKPFVIACGALLIGVAVIGGALLAARSMVVTEYLRFSDPFGDHPPYSRVSFAVEPGNGRTIYGASQEIRVITSGPPVDRLELVLLPLQPESNDPGSNTKRRASDKASGGEEVLPMFGEPGGVWRATIASVTTPLRYYVRCDAGRSHGFSLGVITLPRIEGVRFRVTPPAYTNRGSYEGGLPQGGLSGLPGTTVQIWAKSNRPLAGGSLRLSFGKADSPAATLEMVPSTPGEHEVSATFEIREPGRLELRVRDVDGQDSQDTFATAFTVRADERPFVRVLDPPPVSLATCEAAVPVVVAAEDDYGLARLSLYRSLNDSRALPVDLPLPTSPPVTRQNQTSALAVPAYGLRPGDEIKLFARVEDNDPAGAKGAESPIAVVRIISQEEYEQLVLARKGIELLRAKYERARRRMEEIGRQIEELQKELAAESDEIPLSDEAKKKLADLAERMRKASEEIARSAESSLPFDIDTNMNEHLKILAAKLGEAAEAVDEFADSEPSPTAGEAKEGLEAIRKFTQGEKEQYEAQTTKPLEYLAKVYRLMQDEARFTALYKRQLELADRLESLRGNDSGEEAATRARMRELESEQFAIREDLKRLLRDIENHAQALPDDPGLDQLRETASSFAAALRESGAGEAMADAEAGLAAFSGTRGAEGAREAEQILKRFVGQCQSMGQSGQECLKFAPGLGDNLGNSVEQLLATAGMSTGPGVSGTGGGYSAQMSTLENVGLFGQLPALGGGELGDEDGPGGQAALAGRGGHEGNFESGEPGRVDPLEALRAAGTGQHLVPPEYRQRVGTYFERIADEIGQEEQR